MPTKRKSRPTVDLGEAIRQADEVTFEDALACARRWYYGNIRAMGDEILQRIDDREITTDEGLHDAVQETSGDNQMTIYTAQAGMACAASDNDGAYEDEMGERPPSVEAQAAMAISADLMQYLHAHEGDHPFRTGKY